MLAAIIRKRLNLDRDLYTIMQILSVTLFEKQPILQALTKADHTAGEGDYRNQLELFDL